MTWANYHTHCDLCDGHGRPEAYVRQALQQGARALGFSSHAPLPFETVWTMKPADLEGYCRLIQDLKRRHAGDLPIFLGLEIDYIPAITSPKAPCFESIGLDFSIGAVHFVGTDGDDTPWTVDGPPELFARGLARGHQGNIRAVVETYYALVREMVQTAPPDVVAHLDLVKKNNRGHKYFSEAESWYRQAVFDTLEVIAAAGVILEVNTGGIARQRTDALYPSPWILGRCFDLDIPLTLSADAHRPEHITAGFADAGGVLLEAGYRELYVLGAAGWQPCGFTTTGLR